MILKKRFTEWGEKTRKYHTPARRLFCRGVLRL